MIDLHTHILPGLDDGARDMDTALAMLRLAQGGGTTALFATPHAVEGEWLPEWADIVARCAELRQAAQAAGLSISIYPGAEVAMTWEILDRVPEPGPYCLNGGRYMLVELPATHIPEYADDFFFTLQARGITPIVAHPERHPDIGRRPEILQEWLRRGLLAQLNAPSLTGRMGGRVQKVAARLVAGGLVHFLGSDAHGVHARRPLLQGAADRIAAVADAGAVQLLTVANPTAILAGQDVAPLPASAAPVRHGGWLARLRRWWH